MIAYLPNRKSFKLTRKSKALFIIFSVIAIVGLTMAFAAPLTTLTTDPPSPDGDNGWFKTAPSITLTANETATVTYYSWDGGADTTYAGPFNAPEGNHTLNFYSVSQATGTEIVNNQVFKVDTDAPNTPTLTSPSHTIDSTSNDNTIDVVWPEATDAVSGIDGYSFNWTLNSTASPDTTTDMVIKLPPIAAGDSYTVGLKADGTVLAVGWNGYGQTDVSSWIDIKAVSAGGRHTVGLKADGTVVAVGNNGYGQTNVASWTGIKAVAAGNSHTVGLKADGTVVAVGRNDYGQTNVSSWTDIKAIAAGYDHTVGLKADGTVVAVGNNYAGQTNVSSWSDVKAIGVGWELTVGLKADGTAVAVGSNYEGETNVSSWSDITSIAAGGYHIVGLKADGTVLAVGMNWNGQTDVSSWTGITALAAGFDHTVGLRADGTAVAVGWNSAGATDVASWSAIRQPVCMTTSAPLASGSWYFNLRAKDNAGNWTDVINLGPFNIRVPATALTTFPTSADGNSGWFRMAPSVTLTPDETVTTYYAWDGGAYSTYMEPFSAPEGLHALNYYSVDSLGNTETVKHQAFKVDGGSPNNPTITSLSHTVGGYSNDNTVDITWPGATDAISGVGGYSVSWTPNVTAPPDTTMVVVERDFNLPTIATGGGYTVGLRTDGTVVAAGNNNVGQTNVSSWTDIKAVAAGAGGWHTFGLRTDGTVVAAGNNNAGQTNVSSWTDIKAVAAGAFHTVGLKTDGTVVAVGDNGWGAAATVSSWTDIKAVAAGDRHTVGLKTDGTVVATGNNQYGQTNVSSWTGITAIAAGQEHTVGLKADGTVVAVGQNWTDRTNVSSWTGIIAISAGSQLTIGLKADGTVVAAGRYSEGQTEVSFWTGIIAISVAGSHTVGLKTDGTVVAVGDNSAGQTNVSSWTEIKQPTYTATSAPLADGAWYFNLRTKDYAGNWADAVHLGPFYIDTQGPTTTLTTDPSSPDGDNGWFKAAPSITLSADESGAATYYSWDGGADTTYSGPFNAPEGEHTLNYYSVDMAGNAETINNQSFKVDSGAPTAVGNLTAAAVSTSTIQLSWSASTDNVSDLDRYVVSRSTDGVSYQDVANMTATAFTDTGLAQGTTYYYKVTAYDQAGWSSASDISAMTWSRHEDTSARLAFNGNWAVFSDAGYSGGSEKQAKAKTRYVELTFNGTGFVYLGGKASDRGIADIYIDGVLQTSVDLYSATTQNQQVLYQRSDLADTTHTVKIQVTGAKNSSSSGDWVGVDAVEAP